MLASTDPWEDLQDLRRRLGPFGFQWLCACAIFPVLRFPLTVHLGEVLTRIANGPAPPGATADRPGNTPDVDEQRALYQLPWFRGGRIPEGLRGALVAAIDPGLAEDLRVEIEALLRSWSARRGAAPPGSGLAMVGGAGLGAPDDPGDVADDAILAAFVLGYPPPRRGMAVGDWLGRLLRLRTRLGDLAVAAGIVAASLAAALVVAFWVVRPDWFQTRKTTVTWERRAVPTPAPTTPGPVKPPLPQAVGADKPFAVATRAGSEGPVGAAANSNPATAKAGWKLLAAGESPRPFDVFRDCPDCLDMVGLPGGTFTMGSPRDETGRFDDEDQVSVTLPGFAISRFPVTLGQYAAFVAATGHESKGDGCDWRKPGFTQDIDHPVVCVDWNDATAFAAWMTSKTGHDYRLLSEAEYEYANRAGTKSAYFWGADDNAACAFANVADASFEHANVGFVTFACDDGSEHTSPVGHFAANRWGLYDTTGNVWSWTADCYPGSNAANPRTGAPNTTGDCSLRVVRGGSWDSGPQNLRSASRGSDAPANRDSSVGFRLARTLSPPPP